MQRLLITGAAGGLGSVMRTRLAHLAETVRLSDIVDVGPAGPNEEVVACDLGDRQAVHDLVAGCDGVVHSGGISVEDTFTKILNANIVGLYNLYEAVRKTAKPRVIFASSNHVIGFYRQDQHLDAGATPRPDGLYGVS
jgi:uronate dehydrogenase